MTRGKINVTDLKSEYVCILNDLKQMLVRSSVTCLVKQVKKSYVVSCQCYEQLGGGGVGVFGFPCQKSEEDHEVLPFLQKRERLKKR